MATLASTQVTSCDAIGLLVPVSGLHVEHWRVAMGSVGDTAAITPKRGRFVIAVVTGPATHTLGTLGTDTNVTLTLVSSAATTECFEAQLWIAE